MTSLNKNALLLLLELLFLTFFEDLLLLLAEAAADEELESAALALALVEAPLRPLLLLAAAEATKVAFELALTLFKLLELLI